MESGQLPAYQWAHTRRAAVYLEQMAEHSKIQEESLPKWETEHNRLFRLVTQGEPLAQDIETLICQVRDAMIELDLSEKAKQNYLYCGLGAILKYFDSQGMTTYSKELLDTFLSDTQRKYLSGEIKRAAWQNIRKSAIWITEYQETGAISHRRLTRTSFEYASPDYERLIREYDACIRADGYLKEKTCFMPKMLCLGIAFHPTKPYTRKPDAGQIAAQTVNHAASNSGILNRHLCHKKANERSFFIRICHKKIQYSDQFFPSVVPYIIFVVHFFIGRQGFHIIKNTLLCHKWRTVLVIQSIFTAQ
jgi:hypothetical protein